MQAITTLTTSTTSYLYSSFQDENVHHTLLDHWNLKKDIKMKLKNMDSIITFKKKTPKNQTLSPYQEITTTRP